MMKLHPSSKNWHRCPFRRELLKNVTRMWKILQLGSVMVSSLQTIPRESFKRLTRCYLPSFSKATKIAQRRLREPWIGSEIKMYQQSTTRSLRLKLSRHFPSQGEPPKTVDRMSMQPSCGSEMERSPKMTHPETLRKSAKCFQRRSRNHPRRRPRILKVLSIGSETRMFLSALTTCLLASRKRNPFLSRDAHLMKEQETLSKL